MKISRTKNMDFVLLEETGITKARKRQWRKSLIIAKNSSKICESPTPTTPSRLASCGRIEKIEMIVMLFAYTFSG